MYLNINDYEAPFLLRDFLSYIYTIKGHSARTVNAYYIDLRFFLRFLKASRHKLHMEEKNLSNITISDISEEMILSATISDAFAFLNFVISENDNNANTRSRKVSSIRSFYRYLFEKTGKMSVNPMDGLETPTKKKALPKYLTLEESLLLLNSIDGKQKERDYCIITFLLNCGMRVSELVGIKYSSFNSDNSLRLLGKGNKERIVFLNSACIDAKENYDAIKVQNKDYIKSPYFFSSRNGKPLSTRRVEQIVEQHLKSAGLSGKGISPHKLRHTAATLMYQHGNVDIRVLKEVLGHANIATTEIYTHISSTQLENATNSSPLASIKVSKIKPTE